MRVMTCICASRCHGKPSTKASNCACVKAIGADCVFRKSVTGRFGIVTAEFGSVTDHFGDVTGGRLVPA